MTTTTPNGDTLATALMSGCVSTAVASTLTYPLDCIKTQQQLNNEGMMKKFNVPGNFPSSIAQVYKGCSALVLGSVVKSCARLVSYNWLTKFMATDSVDGHGNHHRKTTAPRIVIAGAMSGTLESLWIIPFENIKIAMIQNMLLTNEISRTAKSGMNVTGGHPHRQKFVYGKSYLSPHAYYTCDIVAQIKGGTQSRFTSPRHPTPKDILKTSFNNHPSLTFFGTVKEIYQLKGITGFTAGSFITIVRQVAVSTVWLSSYNATRQLIDPHSNSASQGWFGHNHTFVQLLGLHLLSSAAVITVTQPIDVIKSHVQLKNGKTLSKDSLSTAYRLFMEQGPRAMFRGALPRGLKVVVSGGLTGSIYEYVNKIVHIAGSQTVFGN